MLSVTGTHYELVVQWRRVELLEVIRGLDSALDGE